MQPTAAVNVSMPVGLRLVLGREPHVAFYDSERDATDSFPEKRSNLHYIGWLMGLLACSALIGFVFAVAAFIFIFLKVKARSSIIASAAGAAAFVSLLGVLGNLLVLEYPAGILQDYVPMPWPFIN